MKNALWICLLEVMFWRNASPTGLACTIIISKCENHSIIVESEKKNNWGWKYIDNFESMLYKVDQKMTLDKIP